MNKPWLIPVIVFIALLLLWPFRWSKVPLQKNTVMHHDNWTGDDWIYQYSTDGVKTSPSSASSNRIIIVNPSALVKYRQWSTKFNEASAHLNKIKSSSEFKEYNNTMSRFMDDYRRQREKEISEKIDYLTRTGYGIDQNSIIPIKDQAMFEARATTPKLSEGETFSYAWNKLPENLRAVGNSTIEAENKVNEASKMLVNIENNNTLSPYDRRNFATGIWAILVIVSGYRAFTSLKGSRTKKKSGKYTEDELIEQMSQLDNDPSFLESQRLHKEAFEYVMLSKQYANSKDYESALNYANQAIDIAPDFSTAYLARSYIYAHTNNPEASEKDLIKVLELNPGNVYAQKSLKNLRRNINKSNGRSITTILMVSFIILLCFLAYLNYQKPNKPVPAGKITNNNEQGITASNNSSPVNNVSENNQKINNNSSITTNNTNSTNTSTSTESINPTNESIKSSSGNREIKYNNITISADRIKAKTNDFFYTVFLSAYISNEKYWETKTIAEYVNELYVDDINLDGISELVFNGNSGAHFSNLYIYKITDGKFTEIFTANCGNGINIIDIDGDGIKEIKTSSKLSNQLAEYRIYKWTGQSYSEYNKYTE